jgi:hypothetical protein
VGTVYNSIIIITSTVKINFAAIYIEVRVRPPSLQCDQLKMLQLIVRVPLGNSRFFCGNGDVGERLGFRQSKGWGQEFTADCAP